MATAAELVMAEELAPLQEVAGERGWELKVVDSTTFRLTLPTKGDSSIQFQVDCDQYPTLPPIWHVRNPDTGAIDKLADFPRGGSFFHSHGVVCAPWNRLAYKDQDARGPHNDWKIGDWRANPKTGGTKTLCAMALRLAVELMGSYEGRLG